MDILEKMPGITVSRYQLLHREPSPKRFYSPANREHSASGNRDKDTDRASAISWKHSSEPEKYSTVGFESPSVSTPSTPLKSILKHPVKATSYNNENDIKSLQILLSALNNSQKPPATERSNIPRVRTPKKFSTSEKFYREHSPLSMEARKGHTILPSVGERESTSSANAKNRQRAKTVSFKLDTNASHGKATGRGTNGDSSWTVMVCRPPKPIQIDNKPRLV